MTSKSLFFKRIKQDLHQRVWFPVILFIISFFPMELTLVSELDRLQHKVNPIERMTQYMVEFFTLANPFSIVTGVAALICALSGFSFMHSARKLDTYHSMPVKREQIFWQQYVYGILYYVIPVVIHVIICLGIGVALGAFRVEALSNMVWFALIQTLFFVLFYSVCVTAVCLTGNMVISVLGCGVLLIYSWVLYGLKTSLYDIFFDTYYYNQAGTIWAFSPLHLIANMLSDADYTGFVYADCTLHYVKMLMQAAVYTLVALWLYKKRPTEAAGKSIAFGFAEPVIKAMIALPVTIVGAFLFRSVVENDARDGWFIFGGIFSLVLSCLVMEAIFRQNPREVFAHAKHLIVNGAIAATVIVIFRFDVFGYDYYMPANVKNYAISIYNLGDIYMYRDSHREWSLENMELTPSESITKLIEQAIEDSETSHNMYYTYEKLADGAIYFSMYVKYELDNGKEEYRCYLLNILNDSTQQLLNEIYNTDEYKLGIYPILSDGWKKQYNTVQVTTAYAEDRFALSEERMAKLIETYQRELKALRYEEIWNESPVASLGFEWDMSVDNSQMHCYEDNYKIYDSFTQTIALLEEYGCIMETTLPAEMITAIEIDDWSVENYDNNGEIDKVMRVNYTQDDYAKLVEIVKNVESSSLVNEFNPNMRVYDVNVDIIYMLNGKEYSRGFLFKPGCMPSWVREELDASLEELDRIDIPTYQ
ncbi:MAG: hypothetical protein E7290_03775 [Lachnospiraceae bacterium]|nr:hypothetical protein [Lachnospiraceae bacterium]